MIPTGSLQKRDIIFTFRLKEGGGFEIKGHRAQVSITNGATGYSQLASCIIEGMRPSEMNRLSYADGLVTAQNSTIRNVSDDYVDIKVPNQQGGIQTIFSGAITNSMADYTKSPDAALIFKASSAFGINTKSIKPLSYKGPVSASQICSDIAIQAGFTGFVDHGIEGNFRNYYCHGSAIDMIQRVVRDCGQGQFRIDKQRYAQILHVWGRNFKNEDFPPVIIGPETGLRGYPSCSGLRVTGSCLFNPALNFWEPFVLNSGYIPAQLSAKTTNEAGQNIGSLKSPWDGMWVPYKLTHNLSCELPNGEWFTYFEANRTDHSVNGYTRA
ncbi:hypothetical protein FAI40_10020 [Acetobacteraceae bacterium]|nr:hypothetical protein FAI40_10020 [Acetobacteraceae bacterium]